jgi:signal transduction histidine kinase
VGSTATRSAAAARSDFRRVQKGPSAEPVPLRALEVVVVVSVTGALAWDVAAHWSQWQDLVPTLLPWLAVVALADLLPVPIWRSVELMISFPVLLASAFVFPPYAAGLLSLFGTFDVREIRREIPVSRALFNRSNVALSVMAAAIVFRALGGSLQDWPVVLPIALAALVVDVAINSMLLIAGTRLLTGVPVSGLVRNVYGASQPAAFASGYVCFGLLAVVLGTTYVAAGTWGLVAFAIPLLLARQMFFHWKQVADAQVRLDEERQALGVVSNRIVDERRDERLTVAAGIHDEVLPPLYKVHLMGQVLRQDLASGRLLDLEADLPDLLQATERASAALRELIRDLRTSALGPGGLVPTLQLLARNLQSESGIVIQVSLDEVPGTPLTHLLVYQVAREALGNVVRHSQATTARVTLSDDGDAIRLTVEDDGCGFVPSLVDRGEHFGLQLMRERIELSGGIFFLESTPDQGTKLVARVPAERTRA